MRKLLATLLAVTMVTSLSACSGGNAAGSSAPAEAPESAAGEAAGAPSGGAAADTAVTWDETLAIPTLVGPMINDGVRAQFAAFEEKYNVEFEVEQLSDAQWYTSLLARAATGELSGLVDFHSGANLNTISPAENFQPMTGESFLGNLEDIYLSSVSSNGEPYGVPLMPVYAGGIAYNKKIYNELGLSVPKTWAEFMANCEAIKAAGYTAMIGSFEIASTAQMIWLTDYYNIHQAYPDFDTEYTAGQLRLKDLPVYVQSFQKMLDVVDYYNSDYLSTSREIAFGMLAEGSGAHYCVLSRELVNILASNYPENIDDVGFFATPGDNPDDNGITIWMPHSWYVAKNTDEQVTQACKLWMEYVTSQEGQDVYFSAQSIGGPVMIKNISYPSEMETCISEAIAYYDVGNWYPAQEFVTPVKGTSTTNICVEVGMGSLTAEEAAQAIDEDNAKVALQLGLEGWE